MGVDIFATKGIEYLLVIGFLFALIVFWRLLKQVPVSLPVGARPLAGSASAGWFRLPTDRFYHQGHTWVTPARDDVVRVGVDDFAQKLVGVAQDVELPRVGDRLEPGERGFGLTIDGRTIDVLSPVAGRVVGLNAAAMREPTLINDDPYGRGWLFEVRLARPRAALSNLLSGKLAVDWMERCGAALRRRMTGELGLLVQDGGVPVTGIARDLSETDWEEIAHEFLLTR